MAHFSIWYVVGAFLLIMPVQSYLPSPSEEKIAYSRFDEFIQEGKVKQGVVGAGFIMETDEEPDGTPGRSKHFKTVRAEILQR